MPYIPPDDRKDLDDGLMSPMNPGQLNYMLTKLLTAYIDESGLNYSTINDCVGALECAKLELYRRVAAPHEETKRDRNGDVYGN